MPIMEVGQYFSINKKINFDELKTLIKDINDIRRDKSNYTELTFFKKIIDERLTKSLDDYLFDRIIDDVVSVSNPQSRKPMFHNIIEVLNEKKIEKFHECDSFVIKLKNKKKDKVVSKREALYIECLRHIGDNIDDINNRFDIKGKIYQLSIIGRTSQTEATIYLVATFSNWLQLLPMILFPIYVFHIFKVKSTLVNRDLDPFLKQLALISLSTSILFGIRLL